MEKLTSISEYFKDNKKLLIALGAGVCATTAAVWYYKRKQRQPPTDPNKWKRVGYLTNLWCFPIKSCGQISLNSADCNILGVQSNDLRDRVFVVTGEDNNFKTARTFPHMTQIVPKVLNDKLILNAPNMEEITVNINNVTKNENNVKQVTVWDQAVPAMDCGDDVAQWLSKFILKQDKGCRLMYYPLTYSKRWVREKNSFSKIRNEDSGAFPDATSYMLINEASVKDLKSKLPEETSCTALQFRPNFVVSCDYLDSLKPYDEDNWKWIRIGDVLFENVKPCTRCIFTNINPTNGIPDPKGNPLKKLKEYRKITDPKLIPYAGDSPILGAHLALYGKPGQVNVGDPVYVTY